MVSCKNRGTIYRRFHTPYPRVHRWALSRFAEAGRNEEGESLAAVAGYEIVGHAMHVRLDNGDKAEVALIVEDALQPERIGRLLLGELGEETRGRGVKAFTGMVLGENRRAPGFFLVAPTRLATSSRTAYTGSAPRCSRNPYAVRLRTRARGGGRGQANEQERQDEPAIRIERS